MAGLTFDKLFHIQPVYSDDGKMQIEGAAEDAGRTKTQVIVSGSQVGAATTTVYTVPAGKVFYLAHYNIFHTANVAGTVAFYVKISGTTLLKFSKATVPNAESGHSSNAFTMPIKLTAGQTLDIISDNAAGTITGNFNGWLENA